MKDFYTDLVGARLLLSWLRTDSIRSAFKGKPAEQEHLTGTVRAAWIEGAYPRTVVRMLVALDPDPSAKDVGDRALVVIDHTDVVKLLPEGFEEEFAAWAEQEGPGR